MLSMQTFLQKLEQLSFTQKRNCFFISYFLLSLLTHIDIESTNTIGLLFVQSVLASSCFIFSRLMVEHLN